MKTPVGWRVERQRIRKGVCNVKFSTWDSERSTYLCFVFFGKPRGVCVWRVGNCDVDVIRLHLHFRNNSCPFSKQHAIPHPLSPAHTGCQTNVVNTVLIFSKGANTNTEILQEENYQELSQETQFLHADRSRNARDDSIKVKVWMKTDMFKQTCEMVVSFYLNVLWEWTLCPTGECFCYSVL